MEMTYEKMFEELKLYVVEAINKFFESGVGFKDEKEARKIWSI